MSPSERRERKYVLTKLASGDYLLPGNDDVTLWRLHTYEDGPSHGIEEWPRDRTLWALRKWDRPINPDNHADLDAINPDDWDRWLPVEDGFLTRSEAIERALW